MHWALFGLYMGSIWELSNDKVSWPRQFPSAPPPAPRALRGAAEAAQTPQGSCERPHAAPEAFPGAPAGVQVDASGLQLAAEVQRLPDARGGQMPCPPPREACLEWAVLIAKRGGAQVK